MEKAGRFLAVLLACLVTAAGFLDMAVRAADANSDFVIVNGILMKYYGSDNSVTIPNGVTGIGESAFEGYRGLTEVTLPRSVTSIGNYSFAQCTSLRHVENSGEIFSIGDGAFEGCISLTDVKVLSSVTNLSSNVFRGCMGLTDVEIPNGVTNIGESAFEQCASLTSITIPGSVVKIAISAFSGCSELENIRVKSENEKYQSMDGVLFDKNGKTLLYYPIGRTQTTYDIPDGVMFIQDYAFNKSKYLSDIVIPRSVNQIGAYAIKNMTVKIQGYENTSAQRYANSNGIAFRSLNPVPAISKTMPDGPEKTDADTRPGWFLIAVFVCMVLACIGAAWWKKRKQNKESAEQPFSPVDLFEQTENRLDAVPMPQKPELLEIICLGCGHSCTSDTKICPNCGRTLKK